MNWRNIHIQNPYKNQTSSISNSQRVHRNRRYTPTRSDSNQSRLIDTSYEKIQNKANHKKPIAKTALSNDHKYIVTQDWIITLKRQIHNLVRSCQSLCDMFKIEMIHMNKYLKISAEQIKEQIIKKMSQITYSIAMINVPKMSEQHIHENDGSIHIPTDGTIKQLIKPFIMSQLSFKDQLSQFGSITKIRTKNSIRCQNNQNNQNNGYLNLVKCNQETLSPTRPNNSDKINTLKKSCSLGIQMEIEEQNKTNHKLINNQKQYTEQTHQKQDHIITKQNIRKIKPTNYENCLETLKKQLHKPKQYMTLKEKPTKQTSTEEIMNPLDLGLDKSQTNGKSKLVSLKSTIKNKQLQNYHRQSQTQRMFLNHNNGKINDIQKYSKKKDMQQTMTAMNQCIINLKKILQKPA